MFLHLFHKASINKFLTIRTNTEGFAIYFDFICVIFFANKTIVIFFFTGSFFVYFPMSALTIPAAVVYRFTSRTSCVFFFLRNRLRFTTVSTICVDLCFYVSWSTRLSWHTTRSSSKGSYLIHIDSIHYMIRIYNK